MRATNAVSDFGRLAFQCICRAVEMVCNEALCAIQSAAQKLLSIVHLVSKQLPFWEQLHKVERAEKCSKESIKMVHPPVTQTGS